MIEMLTRPCTIITRTEGTIDTYGDAVKVEATVDTVCELQPLSHGDAGSEAEGGNIGITRYRLYLAGDVELNADDAIMIDSERYELVGDAAPRRDPETGEMVYTEALVRRVR